MKRTFLCTCAAAVLGLAITASAQPPQPQPSQPTPPAQASAMAEHAERAAKLSGCLKAGATAGSFELATGKKGKMTPAASDATSPAQPPASTSSQAPTQDAMARAGSRNVMLAAGAGVDLTPHVNHQVELGGTWQPSIAAAASADAAKSGKTFNVTSLKMISATCTTGTN